MNLSSLFHTKSPEEVIESCQSGDYAWDLSGRFPKPDFQVVCPQCGAFDIQLSRMMFTFQQEKGCPYTADIFFKCRRCSWGPNGFHFGVKIPEEMYERNNRSHSHNRYEWRQIRDYWDTGGVLDDPE